MAQNISYKSTFRGAVFFFPLANIPRICSNCALVMSLGYFFLIFLLYRFSLTLNRFLERAYAGPSNPAQMQFTPAAPPPFRPETVLSHPRPPSTQLSRHWSPPDDSAERSSRGLQIQRCAALCTCRTPFFYGDIAADANSISISGQRAANKN